MIEKIGHYSLENIPSVYDEEAMTALQLAGRTAKKVNEVIEDQNQLHQETQTALTQVDNRLDQQDNAIKKIRTETVPAEVDNALDDAIQDGTFDRAISEYAGNLEARLDNLLGGLPAGGTTMDAEVIDIRVDDKGNTHDSAGASIRHQSVKAENLAKDANKNGGVYPMTLSWVIQSSGEKAVFATNPFLIPEDGFSVRVTDFGPYQVGNLEVPLRVRIELGNMVNGVFTRDTNLEGEYYNYKYDNVIVFIPHMEGVYVRLNASLVDSSGGHLTPDNIGGFHYLLDKVKVYTGKVRNGGNLLGHNFGTVQNGENWLPHPAAKWGATYSLSTMSFKFCAMFTPLPLRYVNRVTCNPDVWMTAHVYRFDPLTRATEWVETMAYNDRNPCHGAECVLDFSQYSDNYFALVAFGRVPYLYEVAKTGFNGSTSSPLNTSKMGLNIPTPDGVHVDWVDGFQANRVSGDMSPVVMRNVELMRSLRHKVVAGMYNRDHTNKNNYTLPQEDFAGAIYGGGYHSGAFFWNVSPATYYTALLNPNSCAFGSVDTELAGGYYGIVCSMFTSLLHGYPVPLSTFDMRYNHTIPWFERKRINLNADIHKLKCGDILTLPSGETGHSVMVNGVQNVGGVFTALNIMESSNPSTKESLFVLHNGPNYVKANGETFYPEVYTYWAETKGEYDRDIYNQANWVPAYTEPQKVMCSRGYGSVYVNGVNQVILSVDPSVTEISITQDGATLGTYMVDDLTQETLNGYNQVNISGIIGTGTIRVRNNVDDGVEEFHVLDVSGYTVTTRMEGDTVVVSTNHPEKVKYLNVRYRADRGTTHAGTGTSVGFTPNFVNGEMTIPLAFDTDMGRWSIDAHTSYNLEWEDYINVIFTTDHDTNTFGIDAQGDAFV